MVNGTNSFRLSSLLLRCHILVLALCYFLFVELELVFSIYNNKLYCKGRSRRRRKVLNSFGCRVVLNNSILLLLNYTEYIPLVVEKTAERPKLTFLSCLITILVFLSIKQRKYATNQPTKQAKANNINEEEEDTVELSYLVVVFQLV